MLLLPSKQKYKQRMVTPSASLLLLLLLLVTLTPQGSHGYSTKMCEVPSPLTATSCQLSDAMVRKSKEAFVVLLASGDYLKGLVATAQMLHESGTFRPLVVLNAVPATEDNKETNNLVRAVAHKFNLVVVPTEPIGNPKDNSTLLKQLSYTKLAIFGLDTLDKLVFLDLDLLVLDNIDELFDVETPDVAATSDGFPPSVFNSGVMVVRPDRRMYGDMLSRLNNLVSYDGGDQGFLNSYFGDWATGDPRRRLHSRYNTKASFWCYNKWGLEAVKPLKILHFCGCTMKPWQPDNYGFDKKVFHAEWTKVFDRAMKRLLS